MENDDRDLACFTYIWAVENYTSLVYHELYSPWFSGELLEDTWWCLCLVEEGPNIPISCEIRRYDKREEYIHLNFDLSILGADGISLVTKRGEQNFHWLSSSEWLELIDVHLLFSQKEKFLPNDTLTLRCRLWAKNSSIGKSDICFARTMLEVENREFFWTIKEFSQLQHEHKRSFLLQPLKKGAPTMVMDLYFKTTGHDDNLVLEINFGDCKILSVTAKISLMEANGNVGYTKTKSQIVYKKANYLKFEPLIRKSSLTMKGPNGGHYLFNDTVVLRCELNIYFGKMLSRIEDYGHGLKTTVESWFLPENKSDLKISDGSSSSLDMSVSENANDSFDSCCEFCPLRKALERLINEGIPPDVCLQNGKKSFLAHKMVLKSKSPVLKNTIGENTGMNRIYLDTECLHQLLTYIYTGDVRDLNSDVAFNLLEAAKVYELTDLEVICSEFLGCYSSKGDELDGGNTKLPGNHTDSKPKGRILRNIFSSIASPFVKTKS